MIFPVGPFPVCPCLLGAVRPELTTARQGRGLWDPRRASLRLRTLQELLGILHRTLPGQFKGHTYGAEPKGPATGHTEEVTRHSNPGAWLQSTCRCSKRTVGLRNQTTCLQMSLVVHVSGSPGLGLLHHMPTVLRGWGLPLGSLLEWMV